MTCGCLFWGGKPPGKSQFPVEFNLPDAIYTWQRLANEGISGFKFEPFTIRNGHSPPNTHCLKMLKQKAAANCGRLWNPFFYANIHIQI